MESSSIAAGEGDLAICFQHDRVSVKGRPKRRCLFIACAHTLARLKYIKHRYNVVINENGFEVGDCVGP